ncbi:MAG: hypothetical protein A2096_17625 [Spirochaetes bacterium GWF1_41_5]|nr:MAG: hypothetical protein A2096_17625 [Spirochaetes bacterium GWF1_41_5]
MHAGKTDALSLKKEFKPPAVMSIPQMNLFAYRITRPPDQARKPEHKLLEGYRLKEIISINSQRKALVTDASGADIYIPRPGYIIKNYIVIAIEEDRIILADMTGNSGHISNHAANPSIPKFYIQK